MLWQNKDTFNYSTTVQETFCICPLSVTTYISICHTLAVKVAACDIYYFYVGNQDSVHIMQQTN